MDYIIREGALRLESMEKSCDVILCCRGGRLMAHKLMLSIASPVLRSLFLDDFCDSTTIILPDIDFHIMSMILDYIYTGSVYVFSNYLQDFISIATLLKIQFDFVPKMNEMKKEERKTLRKVPNLVPLTRVPKNKKLGGYIIPSPWRPRDEPVLEDPRKDYEFYQKNDSNNNFQCSLASQSINFSNSASSLDTDTTKLCEKQPDIPEKSVKTDEKNENSKRKPFECVDCGKNFSQLRNYKYHSDDLLVLFGFPLNQSRSVVYH